MENKKCYLYAPPPRQDGRTPKRRRLANTDRPSSWKLREQAYHEVWSRQENQIQVAIEEADRSVLEKIAAYVSSVVPSTCRDRAPISTGLVITGPSIASHGPFFQRLSSKIIADTESAFLLLNSTECPNLKTLLKTLIRKAISGLSTDEEDDELPQGGTPKTGLKPLDYDLCLLQDWYSRTPVNKITIAIQDSEGFDDSVLVEMIELLSSWTDRLPFVLLFGIATSAERFQDRLSGSAIPLLEGEQFNVEQAEDSLEKIFQATVEGPHVSLRVGPNLCRLLFNRHSDHCQSAQDFADALKYAYMCHFYANPLSVFLSPSLGFNQLRHSIFEAIRSLASFRRHAEALLEDGSTDEIRNLLDSDQHLFDNVKRNLELGQAELSRLILAISVVVTLRNLMLKTQQIRYSSLFIRSASGELCGSPLIRETLLTVRRSSSEMFSQLLESLASLGQGGLPVDLEAYQERLNVLTEHNTTSTPLKSHYDIQGNTLRTTMVAQKVELSKNKSTLSKEDAAFSDLVGRFHDELDRYLTEALIDPHSLYLSEILMYDLKSPHSEVFAPRPRFVMERALSSPHDYLNCSCCAKLNTDDEAGHQLSASQPPSAILYQLYLESGAMLNVNDLWLAFNAITGNEDSQAENVTTSLFQRALAEFKYFGLVKPSKKKADHVSKMIWKGL